MSIQSTGRSRYEKRTRTDVADSIVAPSDLRLVYKPEVLDRTGLSYQTIWTLMRKGQFPRSREVSGGRTAWFAHEIDEWIASLPVRRLKGDDE